MQCSNCSAIVADGTRFCIHCGMGLTAAGPFYEDRCPVCGGDGAGLPETRVYCSYCRWLRPLGPGYELPIEAFLWQLDADAMNVLRSLGPVTSAAHALSERIGRPWLEASVNGLRLSERQLPEIFNAAIRAGRILGLPYLPEIYISGDQMWDAVTLGNDTSAFIVIGSVLTYFKPEELLYVFGREMGHCRAGHALWSTVMRFVSGKSRRRSIADGGLFEVLNPARLAENAIDAPLMAWSRHSEITADNAGLIAVGKEEVARRVLQTWTFRSFPLQQRINPDAWMEQEDASDGLMTQVAEWTLASAPYLAGRLRLMREFARSDYFKSWRAVIESYAPPPEVAKPGAPGSTATAGGKPGAPPADSNVVRLVCMACHEPMLVPKSALLGPAIADIRCGNPKCRRVWRITPKAAPSPPPSPRRGIHGLVCAACKAPIRIPAGAIAGKQSIYARCPGCQALLLVAPKTPHAGKPSAPAPPP